MWVWQFIILTMNVVAAPTAFVFLLLLANGFSEVVHPPANLTIQCHNFRTVAYWNYSRPSLQPRFSVELFPYVGVPQQVKSCLNITRQHCDVSQLVLGDVQEAYFLNVTAVVGSHRSEAARSSEFTYNTYEVHGIHCSVDFPPVDASVQADGTLRLQFPHPLNFYRAALRTGKKEPTSNYRHFTYTVTVNYTVTVDQEQERLECHRTKGPCEGLLPIAAGPERACLLLEGMMNNIQVTAAEEICLQLPNHTAESRSIVKDDWSIVVWPTVAAVVLVIFAVLGFLVFRRKTNGSSAFPKIMASVLADPKKTGLLLQPERDVTSEVQSVTPRAEPAQEPPQEPPLDPCAPDASTSQEGSRFPIGVETNCEGGFGSEQTCDGPGGSERAGGRREEEEVEQRENSDCLDVESSGYDRPHVVLSVEISPGDRVEGYKPAQA